MRLPRAGKLPSGLRGLKIRPAEARQSTEEGALMERGRSRARKHITFISAKPRLALSYKKGKWLSPQSFL